MENGTLSTYFYFTLFKDHGNLRYIFFVLTIAVYLAIIFFNVILILVVLKDKSLHEPMYLLISFLSINSLLGTAGFFPRLLFDLLSDTHTISRTACFAQIFVIYTYAISEYTLLTVMAFDRYVAICDPLQYHSIMTPKTTSVLAAIAFIYAMFSMALCFIFSVRLPLCGNNIARLYCSNWSVVRLSCVATTSNNIVGFFVTITAVFLPAGFILYSYVRILTVCQRSSSALRGKALQTCLPHIVTFVNYSIASFCDIALSRFEPEQLLQIVAIVFSLEFLVIPPVLNPLIYGLNLPEIRRKIMCLVNSPKIALLSDQFTSR